MNNDAPELKIEEVIVLSKFEGEPLPENEFERVHIKDGDVLAVEKISEQKVVETITDIRKIRQHFDQTKEVE